MPAAAAIVSPGVVCGKSFDKYCGPTITPSVPDPYARRPLSLPHGVVLAGTYEFPLDGVPPRAVLLNNGVVVLNGLVDKTVGSAWHKGDAIAMLEEPCRPAVRSVFRVIGHGNQVRLCLCVLSEVRMQLCCNAMIFFHATSTNACEEWTAPSAFDRTSVTCELASVACVGKRCL